MRKVWTGLAAIVVGAVVAGSCAGAPPTPPRRPADLAPTSASIPLPPPRPAEFSRRRDAVLPPWRALATFHKSSLAPAEKLRLLPDLTPAPTPLAPAATAEELAACDALIASNKVVAKRLPPIGGLNGCGIGAPVSLERVTLTDGRSIPLEPAPVMRCPMAAASADWLAVSVIPALEKQGGRVARLLAAGGYQCRNRNNAQGEKLSGKLSEHAHGDALDLLGARFEDGHVLNFSALDTEMQTAQALRDSACARFATVLGPGADGAHENHIHLDLEPRPHGARLCEWNLR